jgi:hypothetical protein
MVALPLVEMRMHFMTVVRKIWMLVAICREREV